MNPLKSLSNSALLSLSLLLWAAALPSCNSTLEPIQNSCKGVDCSGHGECQIQGGKAVCICEDGYVPVGLSCQDPCSQVTCSYKEKCEVQEGKAVCVCGDGYVAFGTGCIEDPCIGVTCSGHGYCVYQNDEAFCICDEGYLSSYKDCIEDPCYGITCSDHGKCIVVDDQVTCECDEGYEQHGLSCIPQCEQHTDCDDGNPCTDDSCNTSTWECEYQNNSGPCDDGNICTSDDFCSSGTCNSGPPVSEGTPCDDGLFCNGTDSCDGNGLCVHSGDPCGGLGCDENNDVCAGDVCYGINCSGHGECRIRCGEIACVCDIGYQAEGLNCVESECGEECDDGNPCTADYCASEAGECVHGPQNDGMQCDDGSACTLNDVCSAGVCTGVLIDGDSDGIPPESCGGTDCDDNDPLITGEAEVLLGSRVCTNGIDDDCDGKSDAEEFECSVTIQQACSQAGWCIENPFAFRGARAIWGSGASDIWAVPNIYFGNSVYHFDGQLWELTDSYYWTAIWGFSEDDVWAVVDGCVFHWDGIGWTEMSIGQIREDFRPRSIWGTSFQDVWVAGKIYVSGGDDSGQIIHWDGNKWSESYSITHPGESVWLNSISGSGTDDVWAVGEFGHILHWNGDSWSEVDSGTVEGLGSVLSWDIDNAWTVGWYGSILHWNGSEWIQEYSDNQMSFWKIWGTSPDNMWACGGGNASQISTILHWDGSGWTAEETTPEYNSCRDIWGASEDDVWAVGDGYVGHWDGQSWTRFPGGLTNEELEDVFAEDNSGIWVVGNSAVLYWDGSVWVDMAHGRAGRNNNAVWAASPSDAWVVGDGGHTAHWDGTTWSTINSGTDSNLRSIWGSGTDSIWAVGDRGTILHWDGSVWTPVVSGTRETLLRVHGSSDENVWAAGEYSTLVRWDGQLWYPAEFGLDYCAGIQDLLVFSPDDVLITIENGVYHWDGSQWSERMAGDDVFGVRLGGGATDNVWAFSYGQPYCCCGTICHTPGVYNWDGLNWSEDIRPDVDYYFYWVQDVAVTEEGSVIVIGLGTDFEEPDNVMIRHDGW